jgi:hypothetical protein
MVAGGWREGEGEGGGDQDFQARISTEPQFVFDPSRKCML